MTKQWTQTDSWYSRPKPTSIGYQNSKTLAPLWATDWKIRHLFEDTRDTVNVQEFSYVLHLRHNRKFRPNREGDFIRPALEHLAILCGALENPHTIVGSHYLNPSDVYVYPEDAKFIAHFLDAPDFILFDLAKHPSMMIRNAIANRASLSPELIDILVNDEEEVVRATLLTNTGLPETTRVMLGLTVGRSFDYVPNDHYRMMAQNHKGWNQIAEAAKTTWPQYESQKGSAENVGK